jgi:IMP dehydrogenase
LIEIVRTGLTYDDVLLVPKYSDVLSRSDVNLRTRLVGNIFIDLPFISANMDTVTGLEMANTLNNFGAVGVIHRFLDAYEHINAVAAQNGPRVLCVGVKQEELLKIEELHTRGAVDAVLIDVAHGHHQRVITLVKTIKDLWPSLSVIAGNIATHSGALDLLEAGADSIKVGVGPVAACSTRTVTGAGYPQLSAIVNVKNAINNVAERTGKKATLIADGGIKKSADIVKALAAGADSVMIGSLFAGTDEAPGELILTETGKMKKYRGSSSAEVNEYLGLDRTAEGVATLIPYKGPVRNILMDLAGGVRSGLSYVGCRNIQELHDDYIQLVQITQAGQIESRPNILESSPR